MDTPTLCRWFIRIGGYSEVPRYYSEVPRYYSEVPRYYSEVPRYYSVSNRGTQLIVCNSCDNNLNAYGISV